ncbi:hypothetical protein THF1C08_410016 [Vibrio jasicida]|nr:hypothetical protein THF1C08_410016 [Vibrio jasicida]
MIEFFLSSLDWQWSFAAQGEHKSPELLGDKTLQQPNGRPCFNFSGKIIVISLLYFFV